MSVRFENNPYQNTVPASNHPVKSSWLDRIIQWLKGSFLYSALFSKNVPEMKEFRPSLEGRVVRSFSSEELKAETQKDLKSTDPLAIANMMKLSKLLEGGWNVEIKKEQKERFLSMPLEARRAFLNFFDFELPKFDDLQTRKKAAFAAANVAYRYASPDDVKKFPYPSLELMEVHHIGNNRPALNDAVAQAIVDGDLEAVRSFVATDEMAEYLVGIREEGNGELSAQGIIERAVTRKMSTEGLKVTFPEKSKEEIWELAKETPRIEGEKLSQIDFKNMGHLIPLLLKEDADNLTLTEAELRLDVLRLRINFELDRYLGAQPNLSSAQQRKMIAELLDGYVNQLYSDVQVLHHLHIGPDKQKLSPELAKALSKGEGIEEFVTHEQTARELAEMQKQLAAKGQVDPLEVIIMVHRDHMGDASA